MFIGAILHFLESILDDWRFTVLTTISTTPPPTQISHQDRVRFVFSKWILIDVRKQNSEIRLMAELLRIWPIKQEIITEIWNKLPFCELSWDSFKSGLVFAFDLNFFIKLVTNINSYCSVIFNLGRCINRKVCIIWNLF